MWMRDCPDCAAAKADGLQSWMRHLTTDHVVPTEWPSDRAARLVGPLASRPYTTVTESKKKRRKDSIPRPLNSFMLFAQHIRRNVLRVFSDASNSVISQQLGDLWRSVPRNCRTQYDEEANRLVKVHQLEFPNYKYQPKKRQAQITEQNSRATSNGVSVKETTTVPSTLPLIVHSKVGSDSNMVELDQCSDPSSFKHRSGPLVVTTAPGSIDCRYCLVDVGDQSTGYKSQGIKCHTDGTLRLISPSKTVQRTVVNRLAPKCSNMLLPRLHPAKTLNSLSSVLPPLLTPFSKSVVSCVDTCDSAYTSGINSSSSSSASSPAVSELASPAKSSGTAINSIKCSPLRRTIQLVPIRSHSSVNGLQPTRQRFLSASGGYHSSMSSNDRITSHIHHCSNSDIALQSQTPLHLTKSTDLFNRSSEVDLMKVHQVVTPIYVRLDADNNLGYTEDVYFALPPGSTIIQTSNGELARAASVRSSQPSAQVVCKRVLLSSSAGIGVATENTATTSTATTVRPTVQPSHVRVKVTRDLKAVPDSVVCPVGSCSSSSYSSSLSPASDDFRFNQQLIEESSKFEKNERQPQMVCNVKRCLCRLVKSKPRDIYTFSGDEEKDTGVEIIEHHPDGALYNDCTMDVDGPVKLEQSELPTSYLISQGDTVNGLLTDCSPISVSSTVDPDGLLNITASPDIANIESIPMETDFALDDGNFDSCLDAMMSSIDITTFLPGTFSSNDVQLGNDIDDIEIPPLSPSTKSVLFSNSRKDELDICAKQEVNDVNRLGTSYAVHNSYRNGSHLFHQNLDTGLITQPTDSSFGAPSLNSADSSPLSDLDSLDKSSLFPVKPDWSVLA